MRYLIYHPQPGSTKPKEVECTNYVAAEAEYKRLQDVYPSREMSMVVVNEYGDRQRIYVGRWD